MINPIICSGTPSKPARIETTVASRAEPTPMSSTEKRIAVIVVTGLDSSDIPLPYQQQRPPDKLESCHTG